MNDEQRKHAFIAGIRYAATLVNTHWNDSFTAVNQKGQAERSAYTLIIHANGLKDMSAERFLEIFAGMELPQNANHINHR